MPPPSPTPTNQQLLQRPAPGEIVHGETDGVTFEREQRRDAPPAASSTPVVVAIVVTLALAGYAYSRRGALSSRIPRLGGARL